MNKGVPGVLFFCLKFLVLVAPLVVLWWLYALPWYGEFLKQSAGGILKFGFGMNILAGEVQLAGMLNTESTLSFVIDDHEPAMPIAKLISNIPPYVALVLATPALGLWRRLRIIGYGVSILAACHVAFSVIALRIQEHQIDYSKAPTALGQFFLTLPFLLWIIFAYWGRIVGTPNENGAHPATNEKDK